MIAQKFSMVRRKYNNGILITVVISQRIQESANLIVQVADAGIISNLCLAHQFRIHRTGIRVRQSAQPHQALSVRPVPNHRPGQFLIAVKFKKALRSIKGRMGTQIGYHQEKGLGTIPAPQKINGAVRNPVGGMKPFLIHPRPGCKRITFQPAVSDIPVNSQLRFQPVKIVVGNTLVLRIRYLPVSIGMQITVMKFYVVKSHQIPQRMDMHFSHTLGIISVLRHFSRHCNRIIPGNPVLIAHSSVMFLFQSGM